MKEFNLEEAKKGAAVCTRDGREVKILCFNVKNALCPIVAIITEQDGLETVERYTENGKFSLTCEYSSNDLMMATTKHEGWTTNEDPTLTSESQVVRHDRGRDKDG